MVGLYFRLEFAQCLLMVGVKLRVSAMLGFMIVLGLVLELDRVRSR